PRGALTAGHFHPATAAAVPPWLLTMEVSGGHARTRAITRDTVSPAIRAALVGVDAPRDVGRVVTDVSVSCPRAGAWSGNAYQVERVAMNLSARIADQPRPPGGFPRSGVERSTLRRCRRRRRAVAVAPCRTR